MWRINVAVLATLMLVTVSQCDIINKALIESDYLQVPQQDELTNEYNRKVSEAMANIGINANLDWRAIKHKVSRLMKSRDAYYDQYSSLWPIFENIIQLTSGSIQMLKSLLALRSAKPKGEIAYFIALLIGNTGYSLRSQKEYAELELLHRFKTHPESFVLKDLDGLFYKNLRSNFDALKEVLYKPTSQDKLMQLDPVGGELDAKGMIKYANSLSKKPKESMENLQQLLDITCGCLKWYANLFDRINLTRVLVSVPIERPKVSRLNEYYRICLAWSKPEVREQILTKIESKMTKTKAGDATISAPK